MIYDPLTGNLKLDARQAPGGAINHFQLILAVPFDLQATMTVDEITVDTSDFATSINERFLIFNNSFGDGFKGIADFGAIMPKGLSSQDLHFYFSMNQYRSPDTGSDLRTFRLVTAIPEPTAMTLGILFATCMLVMTRKHAQKINK